MKYIITSFFIFALLLTPYISNAQSMNIACVDLKRVVVESDQGKQIQKVLTDEADRLKKTLDTKQDELQKLKDAIEKQGATITPEARAEKEKQYQSKLKDYQRLAGDYQSELQQKDSEYMQKILSELEGIIKSVGEKEKYLIFDFTHFNDLCFFLSSRFLRPFGRSTVPKGGCPGTSSETP